ncbi:hypothetical protein PAPYR_11174 [Paratrimastix pyriformis]|uniref:Uncharacterized protein n=1 Tax=Paratrimastix pyriformis TaxID=342808 RepID=A0ABQ8UA23_9EUKA|nr:hypothetical protein PAPYR_11174 [Paratrimastix pyriformis]
MQYCGCSFVFDFFERLLFFTGASLQRCMREILIARAPMRRLFEVFDWFTTKTTRSGVAQSFTLSTKRFVLCELDTVILVRSFKAVPLLSPNSPLFSWKTMRVPSFSADYFANLERLISLINSSRLSLPTSSWVAAFYFVRVTGPFAGLSTLPDGLEKNHLESQNLGPPFRRISEMLVVSLLAMSQTLRSHSSTCDSEIRTITGHARNSFRAQVLLKPDFHLGLIDLVAREGEYSERSESLLNNRPVVLWVCTWHLHVALFIPWPFFVPEGKPPTSNLSLRQNVWLRPSSRGRVVAEPMLSRGKAGGAHVPAAQLAGFYNNAHCELLPLQHTLAVAREELHLFWARTRGAANSPVSDRRHDDSMSHMEPWRSPHHVSEEGSIVCSTCLGHHPARDRVSMTFPWGGGKGLI